MSQLTQDQQNGWDDFFAFLMNDEKFYLIYGKPGTGKTFLIGKIAKEIFTLYNSACQMMNLQPKYNAADFTATTNKAAEVLEHSLNLPVQTIHSYLSLKVDNNYKTGKTNLIQILPKRISGKVLFIDEASMIDEELFEFIDKSTPDTKVVFVGDAAQLAPVGAEISPIFAHVSEQNRTFLQEPVRNADSPALMALCDQLRRTVETGQFEPIQEVPGTIEYLSPQQMQSKIEEHFVHTEKDSRILCYSNQRVQLFNTAIREMQGRGDVFEPGEVLVAARAYNKDKLTISVERQIIIQKAFKTIEYGGYEPYTPDGLPIPYRVYEACSIHNEYSSFMLKIPCDFEYAANTLTKLKRKKDWPLYFQFQEVFADMRPRYASTVYKSQGSTYDTAFIDIGNIGTCHDPKQVARMLFVAASRARHKLYLFGKLPGKYTKKDFAWNPDSSPNTSQELLVT